MFESFGVFPWQPMRTMWRWFLMSSPFAFLENEPCCLTHTMIKALPGKSQQYQTLGQCFLLQGTCLLRWSNHLKFFSKEVLPYRILLVQWLALIVNWTQPGITCNESPWRIARIRLACGQIFGDCLNWLLWKDSFQCGWYHSLSEMLWTV